MQSSISGISKSTQSAARLNSTRSLDKVTAPHQTFEAVSQAMEQTKPKSGPPSLFGPDLHRELVALQKDILAGKKIPLGQLLTYQIKVGEFHLGIELMSRFADSCVGCARKLQNSQ